MQRQWDKCLPRESVRLAQTLLHQCFTCNKINLRCCSNSFLGSPWYCRFCCSGSHSFYWGSSGCCCTCCSLNSTTHNHWFCWRYGLSQLCVQLHHLNTIMLLTLKFQQRHRVKQTISKIIPFLSHTHPQLITLQCTDFHHLPPSVQCTRTIWIFRLRNFTLKEIWNIFLNTKFKLINKSYLYRYSDRIYA